MTYTKLMLEENAICLGNVCSAKINSGVFLWQQRAPNPAANAQNPWKMFESRCFELGKLLTCSTTRFAGSRTKTLKRLSKFCLFLTKLSEQFTEFEILDEFAFLFLFEPVNS